MTHYPEDDATERSGQTPRKDGYDGPGDLYDRSRSGDDGPGAGYDTADSYDGPNDGYDGPVIKQNPTRN